MDQLAYKLYREQIQPILNVYVQWHTLEYHAASETFSKNWKFSVDPGERRDERYLNFDYHDGVSVTRFCAVLAHGDTYDIMIQQTEPFGSYMEGQDIVGKLCHELYQHINKWAVDNNTPPENMLH